ncbi:MAG: hypothetical protein NW216_05720 [Hyphomicrobium sp.]|nr:hypothetical protein [Hyphomicrobium sp.]
MNSNVLPRVVLSLVAQLMALFSTSIASRAGPVDLCNQSGRQIRAAMSVLEGFDYLSGTWSNRGWHYIDNNDCTHIGGSSLGGSRIWGYVAIERQRSDEEIKALQQNDRITQAQQLVDKLKGILDKKTAARSEMSFYGRLMTYLPKTDQSRLLDEIDQEFEAARNAKFEDRDVEQWKPMMLRNALPDPIESQGVDGTVYVTCLPKERFRFSSKDGPYQSKSCAATERTVIFSLEFFVTPNGMLVISVTDDGIETSLRR